MLSRVIASIVNPSPDEIERQGAAIERHPALFVAALSALIVSAYLIVGGM